jgi:hypothetical protein
MPTFEESTQMVIVHERLKTLIEAVDTQLFQSLSARYDTVESVVDLVEKLKGVRVPSLDIVYNYRSKFWGILQGFLNKGNQRFAAAGGRQEKEWRNMQFKLKHGYVMTDFQLFQEKTREFLDKYCSSSPVSCKSSSSS